MNTVLSAHEEKVRKALQQTHDQMWNYIGSLIDIPFEGRQIAAQQAVIKLKESYKFLFSTINIGDHEPAVAKTPEFKTTEEYYRYFQDVLRIQAIRESVAQIAVRYRKN